MCQDPALKEHASKMPDVTDKAIYPYPWMLRDVQWAENAKFWGGVLLLAIFGPYVACQVAMCTFWEFADKHTVRCIGFCENISRKVAPNFESLVKNPKDGFVIPLSIWLGAILPGWFFYELWHACQYGFDWQRIVVYNIVRIGPMYMNFMFVYVLCHKEGHNFGNLFAKHVNAPFPLGGFKYFYNHWVGLFHGVLPGTFTYSHVYNHHKYDNSHKDVYCTAYRPRDQFSSWVKYLPEWFAYASNVSSVGSFIEEGGYL
jgi:hypothetical protein